jgi:hypothetical protein
MDTLAIQQTTMSTLLAIFLVGVLVGALAIGAWSATRMAMDHAPPERTQAIKALGAEKK